MSELKVFDQLAADITLFVAPTKTLKVFDPGSSASAIEVAKKIKEYSAAIDKKRKELVGPLNAKVKTINDYCKDLTLPLDAADTHVRTQLNAYATEQERLRRIEEARVAAERREVERIAREEREAAERALIEQQQAESESVAESIDKWGTDDGDVERAHAEVKARQEREWAEQQAKLVEKESVVHNEYSQREYNARSIGVGNTRATMKVRILDVALIPKEFLIVTPNEKALIAAGKAGVKIAGVEFYEDFAVAIGRNTRAPRTG